jgi:two-component system nitrogen regulation response regulator GlnG
VSLRKNISVFVADLLGVNRNTLRKKIRDLDIQVFRSSG